MGEPIDVYSDQFMVTTTAFGANLSFYVNTPHPEQTKPVAAERIATIRSGKGNKDRMIILSKNWI